jgi:hypothetical protein
VRNLLERGGRISKTGWLEQDRKFGAYQGRCMLIVRAMYELTPPERGEPQVRVAEADQPADEPEEVAAEGSNWEQGTVDTVLPDFHFYLV